MDNPLFFDYNIVCMLYILCSFFFFVDATKKENEPKKRKCNTCYRMKSSATITIVLNTHNTLLHFDAL